MHENKDSLYPMLSRQKESDSFMSHLKSYMVKTCLAAACLRFNIQLKYERSAWLELKICL